MKRKMNVLLASCCLLLTQCTNNNHSAEPTAMGTQSGSFQFWTPAHIQDFSNDTLKQKALNNLWHNNLNVFTQQDILGNPWTAWYADSITNYFNPATGVYNPIAYQAIEWNAFPGRIAVYDPSLNQNLQNLLSLADSGYTRTGNTFSNIDTNFCNPGSKVNLPQPFGPYGPRGWQDEYCEWSVRKNAQGKITRIDFTCENPEYWNSLWIIDPQKVLQLYQTTLNKPQIKMEDLFVYDLSGKVVVDPSTGRPLYNPLNKWNSGTISTDSSGGAMHLTSTPNTIQTEIGLGASSTLQRVTGNADFNALICCGQYGQFYRNSDPSIGGAINQLVNAGFTVTLANPPGLYIQMPDFKGYSTPDGTDASTFWKIVRGDSVLIDQFGKKLPGNFILHGVFEVPPGKNYTVSDIKIYGNNIVWGSQVAQTIVMHIIGAVMSQPTTNPLPCVGSPTNNIAQPEQLFHRTVYDAMSQYPVKNPVGFPMTLISNSTFIPPKVQAGSNIPMALVCANINCNNGFPAVSFTGTGLTATVTDTSSITYAIPGNSYPSSNNVLFINVAVDANASPGARGVFITNKGQQQAAAMPGLLEVVPK